MTDPAPRHYAGSPAAGCWRARRSCSKLCGRRSGRRSRLSDFSSASRCLNLPPLLPGWLQLGLLVLGLMAVVGLLFRGLRGIRLPDDHAADRRLETRSGLIHRPLSVLTDKPATEDSLGHAIWQAHAARAISQIGRLQVGLPRPGLARLDPRALRYALLLRGRCLSGDR